MFLDRSSDLGLLIFWGFENFIPRCLDYNTWKDGWDFEVQISYWSCWIIPLFKEWSYYVRLSQIHAGVYISFRFFNHAKLVLNLFTFWDICTWLWGVFRLFTINIMRRLWKISSLNFCLLINDFSFESNIRASPHLSTVTNIMGVSIAIPWENVTIASLCRT